MPQAGGQNPVLARLAAMRGGGGGQNPVGPGDQADALLKLKTGVDMLNDSLKGLQVGSEPYNAVAAAIKQLVKHVPQGAPTAGAQQTQLQDLQRQLARRAILQRVLAMQGGGSTPQPMPSTPLPGA